MAGVLWRSHLEQYEQLVALQFDKPHCDQATTVLFSETLGTMPFDLVGHHTIVVPKEAEAYFAHLPHECTDVLSSKDIPAQEMAQLRKAQGL